MKTRLLLPCVCATLAATLTSSAAPAQGSAPVLIVTEPTAETLLIGDAAFKAEVTPDDTKVTSVDFFVDNVPVCRATQRPFECSAPVGERIYSRLVRVVASFVNGERVVMTVRTSAGVSERVDVGAILVPVVVTDYRGRFVKGLHQDSFHLSENGVPQTITSFQAESVPLDLVLAVDISGSMEPSMPALKIAVLRFVKSLESMRRPDAAMSITVVAFNERTFVVAKPDAVPVAREAAINALRAGGGSSIFDAVLRSIDLLPPGISRKAVILFTDGDDRSSLSSIEPVERKVRDSDTTLYLITQGRNSQIDSVRKVVNRLAEVSGGRPFSTDRIDQLQEALDTVVDDLTHQYLLGYESTNSARDGTYRRIVVRTNSGSQQVRAREGYRAQER